MLLRIRMFLLLKKLTRIFEETDNDVIEGKEFKNLSLTRNEMRALKALAAQNAVILDYSYDEICAVGQSDGEITYLLERSELWFNRIVSFILGILTTVAVQYLIRTLP